MIESIATVEPGELAGPSPLERALVLLAEARTVDEVRELRDQAEAMRAYSKRRDDASAAHADCYEIVQCANRRLGELLRELPASPGGRRRKHVAEMKTDPTSETSKGHALRELGIPRSTAGRLEKLAALPEVEFRARLDVARARLTRQADDPAGMTSTTSSTEHDGDAWGTPDNYLDAARLVLGDIDLDPATNGPAQARVKAERFYTRDDDGLARPWAARTVWLNPPYSGTLVAGFCNRFGDAVEAGEIGAGLVLVNACTETAWFQRLLGMCAVCFPDERVAFLDGEGNPIKGNAYRQAVLYAGPKLPLFARTFGAFGRVLVEYGGRARA